MYLKLVICCWIVARTDWLCQGRIAPSAALEEYCHRLPEELTFRDGLRNIIFPFPKITPNNELSDLHPKVRPAMSRAFILRPKSPAIHTTFVSNYAPDT